MPERVQITAEGKADIEAKLKHLLDVEEPETVEQMQEAASQGDLRENFAYHDARRALGMIRGQISELKHTLQHAEVVQVAKADGRVRLGSVVVIQEVGETDEEEYKLVSEAETGNPRKDGRTMVSTTAPLGAAMLNKKVGDRIEVNTPTGAKLLFKIIRVE